MTTASPPSDLPHDWLIHGLAADLKPVRPLPSAGKRALIWLGFVVVAGLVLSLIADLPAFARRFMMTPDMWMAMTGSALTAVLAAIAAFKLSLPDSPRAWAWLPLPALLLWIGASGLGCLRNYVLPGTHVAPMDETMECLAIILALSVPLSILMFAMLREAFSLLPGLTATIAGLAVAAASATLLNLFHPFDAAAVDLLVHAVAVALVIVVSRVLARRIFGSAHFSRPA
jgi:hypothetical protein